MIIAKRVLIKYIFIAIIASHLKKVISGPLSNSNSNVNVNYQKNKTMLNPQDKYVVAFQNNKSLDNLKNVLDEKTYTHLISALEQNNKSINNEDGSSLNADEKNGVRQLRTKVDPHFVEDKSHAVIEYFDNKNRNFHKRGLDDKYHEMQNNKSEMVNEIELMSSLNSNQALGEERNFDSDGLKNYDDSKLIVNDKKSLGIGKKNKGIISRLKDSISGKKFKNGLPSTSGKRGFNIDKKRSSTKLRRFSSNFEKRNINRDEDMLQNLLINKLSLNEAGTVPPSLVVVRRKNLNEDPVLMASRKVRTIVLSKPGKKESIVLESIDTI